MIRFSTDHYAQFDDGYGNCSFIGRGQLVQEIFEQLRMNPGRRYAYSGLFRNGKTSLFYEVARLINSTYASREEKSLAVFFSIHHWPQNEVHFFSAIMEAIHEAAEQYIADGEREGDAYRKFQAANTIREQERAMRAYLEALRSHYSTHIILFIDEFQLLPEYSGCTYSELVYLHDLKPLTIAYIGRLPFRVTVSMMRDHALNADLTCTQKTVPGFSDEDIDAFFQVFRDQYDFDISGFRESIFYHCGRSPYLYAHIGQEVQEKLDAHNYSGVNKNWFDTLFKNSTVWQFYQETNCESVLRNDVFGGMDNLTRLQRIFIGPRIGIRRNDVDIMRELGYIDQYGETSYPITPSFFKWLRQQEITGELPSKIMRAERLLVALIRSKADALIRNTPQTMRFCNPDEVNYTWSPLDLAILNMDLVKVPENSDKKNQFGGQYKLGRNQSVINKYTNYIAEELRENRSPDLLGVLLLKDRLGILVANWALFAGAFGGGSLDDWRDQLIAWCVGRNPQLHANDQMTEDDEFTCERACNAFLRAVGPLFPDVA